MRPYGMYGMIRYFMGFADEEFAPVDTFGGKRFRSGLCLLVSDIYDQPERLLPVALSLELFHNCTLLHDDICDQDALRRGRPTVWKKWGVPHAIHAGDAGLLLSLRPLLGDSFVNQQVAQLVRQFLFEQYLEVFEGQYVDQVLTEALLGDVNTTEEKYFEMIRKKTAVLIGASTKSVGLALELDDAETETLFQYGVHFGMAYQICDDMVSIWGDNTVSGKRLYGDIKEKKKTLPVLYAFTNVADEQKEFLLAAYNRDEEITDEYAREIVSILEQAGSYEYVRSEVEHHAACALSAVDRLTCSAGGKETLQAVTKALLPDIKTL